MHWAEEDTAEGKQEGKDHVDEMRVEDKNQNNQRNIT